MCAGASKKKKIKWLRCGKESDQESMMVICSKRNVLEGLSVMVVCSKRNVSEGLSRCKERRSESGVAGVWCFACQEANETVLLRLSLGGKRRVIGNCVRRCR